MKSVLDHPAIVILGPQGCGKTLLASAIVKMRRLGTFHSITSDELLRACTFSEIERLGVETVVVEEVGDTDMDKMKVLATRQDMALGGQFVSAPTCNFIFCSSRLSPLYFNFDDRRFLVITITGGAI
jgi:hypothetical protein